MKENLIKALLILFIGIIVMFVFNVATSMVSSESTSSQTGVVTTAKISESTDIVSDKFVHSLLGEQPKQQIEELKNSVTKEVPSKKISLSGNDDKNTYNLDKKMDVETQFSAPSGDGDIVTQVEDYRVIPAQTKIRIQLIQPIDSSINAPVHAKTIDTISVGNLVLKKGTLLSGKFVIDSQERFQIVFNALYLKGKTVSILATVLDESNKRGLVPSTIHKRQAERMVNAISNTIKSAITIHDTYSTIASAAHPQRTQTTQKLYELEPQVCQILFDAPTQIKGDLL